MEKQGVVNLNVNAVQSSKVATKIQFSSLDKNSAKLIFNVTKDGAPLPLSAARAILDLRMGDWSTFSDLPVKIRDAAKGIMEYSLTAEQLKHTGTAQAELSVVYENGQSMSISKFEFKIDKALRDQDVVVKAEHYIKDIEDLKRQIESTAESIGEMDIVRINDKLTELEGKVGEGGAGVDEQARQEIQEVSEQLTENQKQTMNFLNDLGVNVKTWGAVADANYYNETTKKYYSDEAMTKPATDNQKVFQDVVNYLSSRGGGTLYAPDGNYVFRSGVKWLSKVSMNGNGIGKTIFLAEGNLFDLFYNLDGNSDGTDGVYDETWLLNCQFNNFDCDLKGLTHNKASVSGKAFFILYMKNARFRDLYLRNTIGTALGCDFLVDTVIDSCIIRNAGRNFAEGTINVGQSGVGIGTGALEYEPVTVTNCQIYDCGNYGIFVETQLTPTGIKSKGAKVLNNTLRGNRHGVGNKGSGGTLIQGNLVEDSKDVGIYLSQKCKDDEIINNKIYNSAREGIYVTFDYGGNLRIEGNEVAYNKRKGIEIEKGAIPAQNLHISRNNVHDNGMAGINLFTPLKDVIISENIVKNNCKNIGNPYNGGIMVENAVDTNPLFENVSIINNTISDDQETKTQAYGIRVRPNVSIKNSKIENNQILGYQYFEAIDIDGKALVNNLKIKGNEGHITEYNGVGTIPDGAAFIDVTFPQSMAKTPNSILLSPAGNAQLWYTNQTRLGMRVNRTNNTGALAFSWKAEI